MKSENVFVYITTGLQCNGKVRGKPFKGTVIVEGCQKPVGMLIHVNGRRLNVTDGYKRTVMKTPVKLIVQVDLEKKDNAVYVSVSGHYVIHRLR